MSDRMVIAIAGLSTAGKSSLGKALEKKIDAHFIDIDDGPLRCGPPEESNHHRTAEGRARERMRMRVIYDTFHAAVESNLKHDFSVIISATYSGHETQELLRAVVERGNGELRVILCQYNDTREEVKRRIAERGSRGAIDNLQESVSHYFDQKSRYTGIELPHITVMMEGGKEGLEEAVRQALEYIG